MPRTKNRPPTDMEHWVDATRFELNLDGNIFKLCYIPCRTIKGKKALAVQGSVCCASCQFDTKSVQAVRQREDIMSDEDRLLMEQQLEKEYGPNWRRMNSRPLDGDKRWPLYEAVKQKLADPSAGDGGAH